jgi:hypothetical protein
VRNSQQPGKRPAHRFSGWIGGRNGRNKGRNNYENSAGTRCQWNSNNNNYENKRAHGTTWSSLLSYTQWDSPVVTMLRKR